ncbi:MAG: prepilin-type N-terminal cleavage/methylation domain-containing protein [Candidatus Omnitrophota bacterium]|jgi:prepilin-type N-terminal cleavage/methylation domain-containing protein
MMKVEKGFTLMEILITTIIVAMLTAVLLSRYYGQQERAIVAEAVTNLSAIRQGEVSYYLENSAYVAYTSLDLDITSTAFTYTVNSSTGTATATRAPAGACSGTDYGSCTVTLTVDGVWGGTHPYKPT